MPNPSIFCPEPSPDAKVVGPVINRMAMVDGEEDEILEVYSLLMDSDAQ
jgi:hypothetical protein